MAAWFLIFYNTEYLISLKEKVHFWGGHLSVPCHRDKKGVILSLKIEYFLVIEEKWENDFGRERKKEKNVLLSTNFYLILRFLYQL